MKKDQNTKKLCGPLKSDNVYVLKKSRVKAKLKMSESFMNHKRK